MDYDLTPATTSTCRCCGTAIIDAGERCKISSNTVRSLGPILIHLLGEHTVEKKQILNFCLLVAHSKVLYVQTALSLCSAEVSEARNGQTRVENKRSTTICRSP